MDDKTSVSILSLAALTITTAAILQWAVLLERFQAAAWAWYKFKDYNETGYITVGLRTQIVFYAVSAAAVVGGIMLDRFLLWGTSKRLLAFPRQVVRIATLALASGVLLWSALLFTPLVRFR